MARFRSHPRLSRFRVGSIAKPYGATNDNTWTWDTTGLPTGTYRVQVWARSVGSTAAYEAFTPGRL